jgi:cytoskeletal protein CcmA (bactofilin family)
MWKPSQSPPPQTNPNPESARPVPAALATEPTDRTGVSSGEKATISKGLVIKGEITGTEPLFIDGKVEGNISLPGNRVTVGRNGQIGANINAREIVILGKVRGNLSASDRVDIRAEGSLTGDMTATRISIEDGAYFKGSIDIRKPEIKPAPVTTALAVPEDPKPALP